MIDTKNFNDDLTCLRDQCSDGGGAEVNGTNLRTWHYERTIENHAGEEARVTQHCSQSNHSSHAVTQDIQRLVRMLILS